MARELDRTTAAKSQVEKTSHPLAVRRTELIWEGKYDADGKRVAPLRVALPFQTVEMVNESAWERQKSLLFESPASYYATAPSISCLSRCG